MSKQYAVIGLGKFGFSVATTLAQAGKEVLAVDKDAEPVQEIADLVTYAARADITDSRVFASLGISNMDVVIVGISENMESSILATLQAKEAGVPLVIVAGRMYGSGSSRDWAAKGPLLLGVRAVIAESFERIHRSNLVQMGILPLEFIEGEGAATLEPMARASRSTASFASTPPSRERSFAAAASFPMCWRSFREMPFLRVRDSQRA